MSDNQCTGPGRPPARRCEHDAVANGLCGSHRRQEKAGKTLTPLIPRRQPKTGGLWTRYGLSFTKKGSIKKLEQLAKASGKSVHDYVSQRIEREWLNEETAP